MKILRSDCLQELSVKKKRSPACQRRSAQRIKDFSRKKRLLALLPKSVDIQDDMIHSLIEKLELENSFLQEKLNMASHEISNLQSLLKRTVDEFNEEFDQTQRNARAKLLNLRSVISQKDRLIQEQSNNLQKAKFNEEQHQHDMAYAWNRIRRCERKIRYLNGQLETFNLIY